jgi:putative iron-regulated protein
VRALASILLLLVVPAAAEAAGAVQAYATVVHRSYEEALAGAVALREAIRAFVVAPDEPGLQNARRAWLVARDAYGRTEAFRFYEGPIDFADPRTGREGPELRLNSWPVDETFIDRLLEDPGFEITRENLAARNAVDDDAHVSTGWHAIEYLLWGRDLDPAGPGARPLRDFAGDGATETRRREYLQVAAELLTDDLRFLVGEWAPNRDNYAAGFLRLDEADALRRILGGLVQLAGFELAMERLAIPLDSRDQEDEHSCFSDNTHADFVANVQGIRDVWSNPGLDQVAAEVAPEVGALIEEQLSVIEEAVAELPRPFDAILVSPDGSPERRRVEELVRSLRLLSELFGVLRLEAARVDG